MLKKSITYLNPFTEQQVTETHYFHISKAAVLEMELSEHATTYEKDGQTFTGMQAHLQKMIDAEDAAAVLEEFKEILRHSYGEKVGDNFIQNAEVWRKFDGSAAYKELIFELLTDAEGMSAFVNGIVPKDLQQEAARLAAKAEKASGTPAPSTAAPAQEATEAVEELDAANGAEQADPTGLTTPTGGDAIADRSREIANATSENPVTLTEAEVRAMDSDELKSGIATGRYKLS